MSHDYDAAEAQIEAIDNVTKALEDIDGTLMQLRHLAIIAVSILGACEAVLIATLLWIAIHS